jgi:hypothetical protein
MVHGHGTMNSQVLEDFDRGESQFGDRRQEIVFIGIDMDQVRPEGGGGGAGPWTCTRWRFRGGYFDMDQVRVVRVVRVVRLVIWTWTRSGW